MSLKINYLSKENDAMLFDCLTKKSIPRDGTIKNLKKRPY
jgi:hypothetical protein